MIVMSEILYLCVSSGASSSVDNIECDAILERVSRQFVRLITMLHLDGLLEFISLIHALKIRLCDITGVIGDSKYIFVSICTHVRTAQYTCVAFGWKLTWYDFDRYTYINIYIQIMLAKVWSQAPRPGVHKLTYYRLGPKSILRLGREQDMSRELQPSNSRSTFVCSVSLVEFFRLMAECPPKYQPRAKTVKEKV